MEIVRVKILFFAKASELSGTKETHLLIPSTITILLLINKIVEQFGLQCISNNILLSVNQEYVGKDGEKLLYLKEGDEIAVIPPISGELVECEINVENVVELVKTPECGAVSLFLGTTRNNFDGKEVKSLQYEAYDSMAKKVIATICDEIRVKWPNVVNIAIYHRMGEVKISETSVLIAISSPHRKESLEAVSYAIDTLKSSVPIWKKEEYCDSTGVWKVNKECSWGESSNLNSK